MLKGSAPAELVEVSTENLERVVARYNEGYEARRDAGLQSSGHHN